MKGNQSINEESFQNFSKSISNKIHKGFILVELNDKLPFAILSKKGKQINHGFNFLISCFTFGLWFIPWIYLTYVSKTKKILVALDEDGNVFQEDCYIG